MPERRALSLLSAARRKRKRREGEGLPSELRTAIRASTRGRHRGREGRDVGRDFELADVGVVKRKETCLVECRLQSHRQCRSGLKLHHTSDLATAIAASIGNLRVGSELSPTSFFVIPVYGEGQHSDKNNWSDEDT